MDQQLCQSCGMPLGVGFYGTNSDGSASNEYCKFCFENGNFREPNITLEDMIGRSIANMIDEKGIKVEDAQKLAREFLPNLKRWR